MSNNKAIGPSSSYLFYFTFPCCSSFSLIQSSLIIDMIIIDITTYLLLVAAGDILLLTLGDGGIAPEPHVLPVALVLLLNIIITLLAVLVLLPSGERPRKRGRGENIAPVVAIPALAPTPPEDVPLNDAVDGIGGVIVREWNA